MSSPSDSESSSNEDTQYFFKNDLKYADIKPIPQDDGPNPVVQIMYTDVFKDHYDYFRAIYKAQEISERAYFLTEKCIEQNPSNYTVWEYRRRIVKQLNLSCETELAFTQAHMGDNPKNYQMWHHRYCMLEIIEQRHGKLQQSDIDRELRLSEKIFKKDAKNYHAWQNRIILFKNYNSFFTYENEMNFIKDLINKDFRNNSVWNYLYTIHNDDEAVIQEGGSENEQQKLALKHTGYGFSRLDYDWLYDRMFVSNLDTKFAGVEAEDRKNTPPNDYLDLSNEVSWNLFTAVFNRKETLDAWRRKVYNTVEGLLTELDPVPFAMVVFLLAKVEFVATGDTGISCASKLIPKPFLSFDTYKSMNYDVNSVKNQVEKLYETDPIRINYWKFVHSCLA